MNCAPCITRLFSRHLACPVPEKGVSGTEFPFGTPEACFLHRGPQKMRRVPQEPVFCTARIFGTVGGPLRYRMPTPSIHTLPPQHFQPTQNTPANSTPTQRPTTATQPATHPANTKHHQHPQPPQHSYTPNPQHPQPARHNRVGGKRSSFLPTFVFRPLTPPYMRFRIRRFLFWVPFEIRLH